MFPDMHILVKLWQGIYCHDDRVQNPWDLVVLQQKEYCQLCSAQAIISVRKSQLQANKSSYSTSTQLPEMRYSGRARLPMPHPKSVTLGLLEPLVLGIRCSRICLSTSYDIKLCGSCGERSLCEPHSDFSRFQHAALPASQYIPCIAAV